MSSDDVAAIVTRRAATIPEATVRAFGPPPIRGLGSAGGFEFYVQARARGLAARQLEQTD